ncbi:hypothetical protein JO972_04710 [Verrucomicrobiaceae bacterium 5K15]|uniref:DAGKc domain-containing protein n=1 Tax=Oceaniferula flava TaxID=2800421 RepID=A0AAE2SC71_9BACT|nr:diacylglycerol kinase family protein [Oceaniferula flavus]MBK1854244.1 hypothetical protein [Oceaniferula flavus]MBM1135550.1 hypothetical protein [Oceaniferula flavus]
MRQFIAIVNQESGLAKKSDLAELSTMMRQRMAEYEVTLDVKMTRGAEVESVFQKVIPQKPDGILVAGGDGTVNTAAGMLAGTGIAMGILPMGTFNLAARDHDIPLELDSALTTLARAEPRDIQLMKIGNRPCLCTAIIGFYPKMARMIDEYHGKKWWRKSLRIFGWTVSRFAKSTVYRVTITGTDGEQKVEHQFKSRMLSVVPGAYRDTLGIIPERKQVDRMKATVYVFRHLTRWAMLRGMLSFLLGKSSQDPDMEEVSVTAATLSFQGKKEIKIMIDGEVTQLPSPLKIELIPHALRMLIPNPEV